MSRHSDHRGTRGKPKSVTRKLIALVAVVVAGNVYFSPAGLYLSSGGTSDVFISDGTRGQEKHGLLHPAVLSEEEDIPDGGDSEPLLPDDISIPDSLPSDGDEGGKKEVGRDSGRLDTKADGDENDDRFQWTGDGIQGRDPNENLPGLPPAKTISGNVKLVVLTPKELKKIGKNPCAPSCPLSCPFACRPAETEEAFFTRGPRFSHDGPTAIVPTLRELPGY